MQVEPDDESLVLRAQGGDGAAAAHLMRRYEGLLRHVVSRSLGITGDVDDVLQETALQVWQHIHTLREPTAARAWIVRIARNTAVRSAARLRPHDELDRDMAAFDGPDLDVERFDLHRDLAATLSRIPVLHAQVWHLRVIDDLSYREIAARLEVSEATVRGALVSARRRVLESMSKRCPLAGRTGISAPIPAAPQQADAAIA